MDVCILMRGFVLRLLLRGSEQGCQSVCETVEPGVGSGLWMGQRAERGSCSSGLQVIGQQIGRARLVQEGGGQTMRRCSWTSRSVDASEHCRFARHARDAVRGCCWWCWIVYQIEDMSSGIGWTWRRRAGSCGRSGGPLWRCGRGARVGGEPADESENTCSGTQERVGVGDTARALGPATDAVNGGLESLCEQGAHGRVHNSSVALEHVV